MTKFVIYYKKIHDLNLIEEFYTYDDSQNRIETKIYLDKELKRCFYNLDGSRKEIVYSKTKGCVFTILMESYFNKNLIFTIWYSKVIDKFARFCLDYTQTPLKESFKQIVGS